MAIQDKFTNANGVEKLAGRGTGRWQIMEYDPAWTRTPGGVTVDAEPETTETADAATDTEEADDGSASESGTQPRSDSGDPEVDSGTSGPRSTGRKNRRSS